MDKLTEWLTKPFLDENVDLPIEVGDTVKMGKFKNKKVVIKKIDWNEKGDLLINGRPALKFRLMPKTNIFDESPRVLSSKERRLKDAIQKKKWYPLYVKVEKKVLKKLAKDGKWKSVPNSWTKLGKYQNPDDPGERYNKRAMRDVWSDIMRQTDKEYKKKYKITYDQEIDKITKQFVKEEWPKNWIPTGLGMRKRQKRAYGRLNRSIREGVNDPGIFKAVFLAGGPGSGKSYVAGGLFGIPDKLTTSAYGLKLVNQDTELEMFLKKYFGTTDLDNMPDDLFRQITDPSYSQHMGVRQHAKALSKQRLKLYSQGRLGVIIDGTGHKYKDVKKERQKLIDLGYDTYMVFVNTSLEVAQKRNKLRDRVLPEEIVEKYWKNVQKNMAFFQGLFGNQNFMLVDNNSTLSPKQAQKKFNMLVKKGIGKFIRRPIKNKQAKKWIEKQKITTEMLNPPNYLDNQAPTPVNSPEDENLVNRGKRKKKTGQPKFGTFRKESIGLSAGGGVINGAPSVKKVNKVKKQLDKDKKKRGYEPVNEDKTKIKKVIGIYGGRFQPFGPHHKKTYEWLKKQVDDAYITTSNIKQPPRHPMNFKEKVRHMVKMGIPKNRIIEERTPYVAKNTLSKFDEETTAVIYIFGEKDANRLKGGKYFQDYKKNKNNMVGHREHGYILTAPHVSMRVGGVEVSGTSMRELLGSPKYEEDRERRFKKFFGYYDKGVFNMMTNKFSKLYEVYDNFLINNPDIIPKLLKEVANSGMFPTDDGPPTFYDGFEDYKRVTKTWIENMYSHEQINDTGWELLSYIISDSAVDPGLDYTTSKNIVPAVAYGRKGTGAYGERFGRTNPIEAYKDRIKFIMGSLGWEVLNWNGITPDGKNYTGVEVEAPVSAGVDEEEVGQNTERAKNLDLSPMDKFHGDKIPDENEGQYKDLEERLNLDKEVQLLIEGGAYGHMNHPFDDKNLTFGDLKNIITLGLGGKLSREDNVTEKLDGQNLMISWKDGKLVTARNKGQLKNFGANSMDASGVASKFAGRGDIRDAFVFAMNDLGKSIGRLSNAQKEKIFGNGKNWMNLEVIYPASSNVINYDKAEIVFHGALEYDESGKAIGELKGSGRMLAGMIKQVNQHIQKHYKIGKPQFLQVSKVQDFGKKKTGFISRLNKLQKEYALNDNDTLSKYHQSFWEEFIFNATKQHKAKISNKVLINLTKRWAFFDKSYKISQIKKDLSKSPDFLDWVLSFDKNDHQKWVKDNMKPFEVLFFDVGAEILKNISGYLAVSGDTAVQKIRKDVINAIKTVKRGGDIKKIETLKHQLDKLEKIGGLSSIVPSEGIVFKYKGNTYKFTGSFAPINQILGLVNF